MTRDTIHVRGAREHNLKNVELEIPRGSLVVFSGISGSGKSSLAFDTIFAEGQRRYVESLSAYARQFLGQLDKPDVDYIDGLSPAISIDQKSASHNPRSTVGTVTEIYDYLRLLYARIGHPHCPKCGREIQRQSVEQIVDDVMAMPPGSRIMILGPVVRGRKGEYRHVFEEARKAGYIRVRVDGEVRELAEDFPLDKYKQHDIEVVVDRLVLPESDVDRDALAADRSRLADSVETALKLGEGIAIVKHLDAGSGFIDGHCRIVDRVRHVSPTPDVLPDDEARPTTRCHHLELARADHPPENRPVDAIEGVARRDAARDFSWKSVRSVLVIDGDVIGGLERLKSAPSAGRTLFGKTKSGVVAVSITESILFVRKQHKCVGVEPRVVDADHADAVRSICRARAIDNSDKCGPQRDALGRSQASVIERVRPSVEARSRHEAELS
jgi:hypothetical protein